MSSEIDQVKFATLIKVKINQIALMSHRGYLIPAAERHGDEARTILSHDYTYARFQELVTHYKEQLSQPDPEEDDITRGPTPAEIRQRLSRVYVHAKTGHKTGVYFVESSRNARQVPKAALTAAITFISENWDVNSVILIIPKPLAGRDAISDTLRISFEIIEEKHLYTTPIAHRLNQPMAKLTPEARQDFLARTAVPVDCIPRMFTTDPNVTYYGFKEGDIVACMLYDPYTGGPSYRITYRIVVLPPIYKKSSKPTKK